MRVASSPTSRLQPHRWVVDSAVVVEVFLIVSPSHENGLAHPTLSASRSFCLPYLPGDRTEDISRLFIYYVGRKRDQPFGLRAFGNGGGPLAGRVSHERP